MRTGNSRRTIYRAKNDWELFVEHGYAPNLNVIKKMLTDDAVMECVKYIFKPSDRQVLATRTRKVKMQDGNVLVLPKVRRTESRKMIMSKYMAMK